MRPTRLEVQGFASFREPTVLDLTDVDLFVLSGPTGAGKSSLIDAMTFALYGSVPRYDNKNLVAPVISQGQLEARVQLDLAIEDRHYRATRVVRRTKTGATTKEARLELVTPSDTSVIAGTADELTATVEELLGLTFDHFVRTVVLPQGAFQAFMHAKPKERQDLLVELLELDIYRRVASVARDRASRADAEIQALERQLSGPLADVTPAARDAAAARAATFSRVVEQVEEMAPKLDAIKEEGAELSQRAKHARAEAQLVATVAVPDGVAELSSRLAAATTAASEAEAALAAATDAREDVEARAEGSPALSSLRDLAAAIERTPELAKRVLDTAADVEHARGAVEAAAAARETAGAVVAEARGLLESARRRDLAQTLARDLSPGDDCPVCARTIEALPDHTADDHVSEASRRLAEAEQAERDATAALTQAERGLSRAEAALGTASENETSHRETVAARAAELGLAVDETGVRTRMAEVEEVSRELAAARDAERRARKARDQTKEAVRALDDQRTRAWEAFDEVRDRIAALSPPPVDRDDLAKAWSELAGWAARAEPRLSATAEEATAAVEEAQSRWREVRDQQWLVVTEAGLPREGPEPRDVAVDARNREQLRLEQVEQALEELDRVRTELAAQQKLARLGRELGLQLSAKRFEQWLLNRALTLLVGGASSILRDLSRDAYSLALDDTNSFLVIDHRNADEARSARTLSGGETFLASLSLALALSEQVADLAAQGSARLDALFIDEGFGTLDADTLDTVATAIEELGSRGRMVGLVTHVQDLAQRLPVRFEVTKTASTSSIERIDA